MAKRKLEELDLSNLLEDCDHGIVHGVVTHLSPIKKSCTNRHYFQAQLSDGTKSIEVVSFDPSLRPSMDTSQKDRKAIKLTNCRVQKELTKPDPEIFLNNHSQITKSPCEIHVPDHLLPANGAIQMSEIKSVADMAKITAQIKVVNVEHPTKIRTQLGKELLKQDCLVADSSARCRLVAWEKDVRIPYLKANLTNSRT